MPDELGVHELLSKVFFSALLLLQFLILCVAKAALTYI